MIIQDNSTLGSIPPLPGVLTSYNHGISSVGKYLGPLLLILLVVIIFGIPSYISGYMPYIAMAYMTVNIILYFYSFFVTGPLEYGVSYTFLKAVRGEKPEVKDLGFVLNNYWNILLANLLIAILVSVGFLLFIIPGIFFLCKLAFVRYLLVEKKMSAMQAIEESWQMTNGHAGTIFLMGLLAIPIIVAGAMLLGIGIIFSMMWIESAFATLYHAVSLEKQSTESVPEQPGPFV